MAARQAAPSRRRLALLIGGLLYLGSLPILTHARVLDWQNDQALWSSAVTVTPNRLRPWVMLAIADVRASDFDAAGQALGSAFWTLAARPGQRASLREATYVTAARVAWKRGDRPLARYMVHQAFHVNPASRDAFTMLDLVGP